MSRSWELPLHITAPLNLNDRGHWRVKAKTVRDVRNHATLVATAATIPELRAFTVELHYVPRDKRRRDPENLIATLKPFVDGLIDAGVAPDDCPPYYTTTMPVIDPPNGKGGRLYAIVREMPDPDDAHDQGDIADDLIDDDPWSASGHLAERARRDALNESGGR